MEHLSEKRKMENQKQSPVEKLVKCTWKTINKLKTRIFSETKTYDSTSKKANIQQTPEKAIHGKFFSESPYQAKSGITTAKSCRF